MVNIWRLVLLLIFAAPALRAADSADEAAVSSICDAVSAAAARAQNMPLDALYAITLSETGRTRGGGFHPWPWTVNMEGKGFWFDTREEAYAFVMERYNAGARSFDVGCFQLNYKWHGQNFASIDAMFDPMTNATYAAQLLSGLYREFGDWTKAAGAYHSRTETYANRYRTRYARIRARLNGQGPAPVLRLPTTQVAQVSRFPGVQQAFLYGPPIAAISPYSSRKGAIGNGAGQPPAAQMGSLAVGMLGGTTVTLLTRTNGALF